MKKVCVITGAGGVLCSAFAAEMAKNGMAVALLDLNVQAAAAVADQINAEGGCAKSYSTDVLSRASLEAAAEAIHADLGKVDILINNAGICHYGLISQISQAEWDRIFAVNVGGIYHCVNAVLPGMLQKQSGCIINVASMWGQVGASCEVAYSATKGAVIAMSKALAQELGPSGIRVNCVSPGVILTDMTKNVSEETLHELAELSPLGKNGSAEQVAQAFLYLSQAEFVTGENLSVNGGFVL